MTAPAAPAKGYCGAVARKAPIDPADDSREGTLRQLLEDIASKVGSLALLVGSVVLFVAGAIAGVSAISRLGGAGWLIYIVVMSTYALVFGPVVASAYDLYHRGSASYREEQRKRLEEQRRKFGLHLRTRDDADDADQR